MLCDHGLAPDTKMLAQSTNTYSILPEHNVASNRPILHVLHPCWKYINRYELALIRSQHQHHKCWHDDIQTHWILFDCHSSSSPPNVILEQTPHVWDWEHCIIHISIPTIVICRSQTDNIGTHDCSNVLYDFPVVITIIVNMKNIHKHDILVNVWGGK